MTKRHIGRVVQLTPRHLLILAALTGLAAFFAMFALLSYYYEISFKPRASHIQRQVVELSSTAPSPEILSHDIAYSSKTLIAPGAKLTPPIKASYGLDRAIADLRLDPRHCNIKRSEQGLVKKNRHCKTSATCPLGQFCHPERKFCGAFCQPLNPGHRSPPEALLPREGDVWLVSYPKSGSTWLRHLIWNLHVYDKKRSSAKGNFNAPYKPATFDEVDEGIPFLEDRATGPIREIFKNKQGLRIFKSHQPYSCDVTPCRGWVVARQAKWQCQCPNCASKFRRVIYVVRDGRPTMVSYWNFQGELHLKGYRKRFGQYLSLKQRRYPGVGWSDHVRSWMSAPVNDKLDILWVRYEDMRSNTAGVLRRVAKFLKTATDDEAIEWAVNASSKESMAKTEEESGPGIFAKKYKKRDSTFRMVHLNSEKSDGPAHKIPWQSHFIQLMTTPRFGNPAANSRAFNLKHKYMLQCLGYPVEI